jgi:molybdopterin-containing oxidoreductase family iron-sulfur binding subunit
LAQPDLDREGRPRNPKAFRLLERLGTNPKVYYLTGRDWVRKAGDNEVKKS